jgi:cellulase/cellobiase CelA1
VKNKKAILGERAPEGLLGILVFATLLQACSVDYSTEDSTPAVQALAATGMSVSLTYQSDWKAGYCSTVSITNTGPNSISAWQVVINLGQARLAQLWKGNSSFTGPKMTVTPSGDNSQVSAGATASFGFCANAAGPGYHPTLVSASNTVPSTKS